MPRKIEFEVGEYYHIFNRGVDKRDIFNHDEDKLRFLQSMEAFNRKRRVEIRTFDFDAPPALEEPGKDSALEDPLVEIHCFSLMENHFHFILKQSQEKGVSLFMSKLLSGYTHYFNKINNRSGVLFQGPFRCTSLPNEASLLNCERYVHLNPLDYFDERWREYGVKNIRKCEEYLLKYPWSSCRDFIKDDEGYVERLL